MLLVFFLLEDLILRSLFKILHRHVTFLVISATSSHGLQSHSSRPLVLPLLGRETLKNEEFVRFQRQRNPPRMLLVRTQVISYHRSSEAFPRGPSRAVSLL